MNKFFIKLVVFSVIFTMGLITTSCEGEGGGTRLVGKTYRYYDATYDSTSNHIEETTREISFTSKTQCKTNEYGYYWVSDGWDNWSDDIKWKKESWSEKRTLSYTRNGNTIIIKNFYSGSDLELQIGSGCLYNNYYVYYLL